MLAVVLAVGGYGFTRVKATARTKVAAAAAGTGRLVTARTGDISIKVSENGTLEPVNQVDVKSTVAGRLSRITVKEGDRVAAGALLAVIDPIDITRQMQQTRAQLASQKASLRQAEENYLLTQKQNALAIRRAEAALAEAKARLAQAAAPTRSQEVEQAEAQVRRAEAQVADAQRSWDRQKALVAKGFVAQSAADAAQTQASLAEADLASAKERVSLLKEGARREDVAAARASVETARVQLDTEKANAANAGLRLRDVERARAEVAQIENQLSRQDVTLRETRIVAPRSGEITGKFVNEGELVASATAGFAQGATLVKIADLSRMQVRVNVNEVDIARVRVGLPVEVRVDGVPGKVFQGKVAAISPSSLADKQGGANASSSGGGGQQGVVRFEVKVAVVTPDPRLRPGMTAAVDILLDRHKNVTLLPAETLKDGNRVTVVTGVGEKQAKAERTLNIGLRDDAQVEVVSGLKPGEKVEVPKVKATDRRKVNFDGPN
jgi:HlyD family secretion protein